MVVLDTKFLIIYGFLLVLVSCAELPPVVLSNGGPEREGTVPEASRTAKRGGGGKSKQNIQHVQVVVVPNSQVHQPNIDGDPQAAGYVWVPYLSDGPSSAKPPSNTPLLFRPSIQQPSLSRNPFLQGTVQIPQPVQTPSNNAILQATVAQPQATQPQLQPVQKPSSNNPFLQGFPLFPTSSLPQEVKGTGQYGWGHAYNAGNQQVKPEEKPQLVVGGPQLSVVTSGSPQQAIQPVLLGSPQFAVVAPSGNPQIQSSVAANPHVHNEWGHADSSGPRQVPNVGPQVPQVLKEGGVLNSRCLKAKGQFPSDACNAYVNCWNGEAVEQTCPDGLVFSTKGYCDYPENVDCYGRRVPAGIPPTPAPSNNNGATPIISIPNQHAPAAPAITNPPILTNLPPVDAKLQQKCQKARGQFPSDSCNRYVNCWDDVITEEQCPEGLLFSEKGYCDYPHRVTCHGTTPSRSTSSTSSSSTTHEAIIVKECPVDFGTFRDKTDCTSYFTCIAGKVVAKYKCPEGLSYSDNLGVCDYNERVDCSKPPMIFTPKSLFMSKIANSLPNNLESCKPGTILRLNPQCTSALLCRNGLSEVVQCPTGLAYDSKTDKCVLPTLAQC